MLTCKSENDNMTMFRNQLDCGIYLELILKHIKADFTSVTSIERRFYLFYFFLLKITSSDVENFSDQ